MTVSIIRVAFQTGIAPYAESLSMSRNILKYPITKDEVIKILERYLDDWEQTQLIGGQEGYILSSLICVIEREFRHEDFNPYTKEDTIG